MGRSSDLIPPAWQLEHPWALEERRPDGNLTTLWVYTHPVNRLTFEHMVAKFGLFLHIAIHECP